jgi:hypothetical protein
MQISEVCMAPIRLQSGPAKGLPSALYTFDNNVPAGDVEPHTIDCHEFGLAKGQSVSLVEIGPYQNFTRAPT